MTGRISFILAFVFLISCGHKGDKAVTEIDVKPVADTTNENFFPVTNYLKGQISEIKKSGVNPLKYTIQNNTTDSAWIKMENVEKEMAPFLEPLIDTANM